MEDHEPLMMLDGNVSAEPSTERTIDENFSTTLSEESNSYAEDSKLGLSSKINEKSHCVEGVGTGKEIKKRRKYRVDILRCESLAALAPATLDRLFHRDYDIIMSMIPLPHSSVLPGPKGPIHFGPPSHSSMTSWMKLVLYSALSSGPLSVVLMKGQCLRLLPAPLAGCEKALVWSWDGSTIGGLGGKLEGNLVKGSILLHCLNSLLKCTAVLVQPLSRYDLDDGGKVVTLDVPLPLKNSDGSMASIGEELGLCREESLKLNTLLHNISNKINLWTMGYIRLLRLFKEGQSENFSVDTEKYEWVPLSAEFDLQKEHHEAMQDLRTRLRDVCAEYQATGPTAKLLYQKEHQKDKDSSRELMTYASGRWNPLSDPSSPISGALSEKPKIKTC
ncbi:UNVERIFIED_CONTAM: protein FAM91A1 [Sesamum latifolium]|uniref:Protein FAM91A1 n=1 Tax=Sesamum latifolium TaxID=2727402 RepID=A0AAW2WF98_9LAMI